MQVFDMNLYMFCRVILFKLTVVGIFCLKQQDNVHISLDLQIISNCKDRCLLTLVLATVESTDILDKYY